MYCPKCGTLNSDEDAFCSNCGTLRRICLTMTPIPMRAGNMPAFRRPFSLRLTKRRSLWTSLSQTVRIRACRRTIIRTRIIRSSGYSSRQSRRNLQPVSIRPKRMILPNRRCSAIQMNSMTRLFQGFTRKATIFSAAMTMIIPFRPDVLFITEARTALALSLLAGALIALLLSLIRVGRLRRHIWRY